jgi:hypothetical protein
MLPVFCILIVNSCHFSTQYSTNGMNTSSLKTNNLPPIFFTFLIININSCHTDGYVPRRVFLFNWGNKHMTCKLTFYWRQKSIIAHCHNMQLKHSVTYSQLFTFKWIMFKLKFFASGSLSPTSSYEFSSKNIQFLEPMNNKFKQSYTYSTNVNNSIWQYIVQLLTTKFGTCSQQHTCRHVIYYFFLQDCSPLGCEMDAETSSTILVRTY